MMLLTEGETLRGYAATFGIGLLCALLFRGLSAGLLGIILLILAGTLIQKNR